MYLKDIYGEKFAETLYTFKAGVAHRSGDGEMSQELLAAISGEAFRLYAIACKHDLLSEVRKAAEEISRLNIYERAAVCHLAELYLKDGYFLDTYESAGVIGLCEEENTYKVKMSLSKEKGKFGAMFSKEFKAHTPGQAVIMYAYELSKFDEYKWLNGYRVFAV